MITRESVEKIVQDGIQASDASKDMFVVSVQILAGNRIEVVLDSDTSVTIDDCVRISRLIEAQFDREVEDFELSVYSAGLSEPLTLQRQYLKHLGKDVEVLLKKGVKLKGVLHAMHEGALEIKIQKMEKAPGEKRKKLVEELLRFDLSDVKHTKLVIKV